MSSSLRALFFVTVLPAFLSAQDTSRKSSLSAFDRPFIAPEMTALAKDLKPFEYKDVGNQIPDYKGNKGGKKGSTLNLQQVPLRPEESIKHMVVPKGLKVELVAADPDI